MGSILLATDGSEYARTAARRAIELADERDLDLYVLCVVDRQKFGETAISSNELATIVAEDKGYHCVDEVTKMAQGTDVRVDGAVRHGVPHETILEYADDVDAELIIVGEHGHHQDHFGGVGRKIDELSEREVLVVTQDASE